MTERLIGMLLRLSRRERLLLAGLVLGVLPLALWLTVLAPLAETRATAERHLQEARALGGWVALRAADQAGLAAPGPDGPVLPIGISGLEQGLVTAGLRDAVTDLANAASGAVELRFDAVPFADLMAWLSQSDPGWGYDIAAFRLERSDESGLVAADLRLEPRQ